MSHSIFDGNVDKYTIHGSYGNTPNLSAEQIFPSKKDTPPKNTLTLEIHPVEDVCPIKHVVFSIVMLVFFCVS